MTWVKICGITNLEDALVAVEAGADAVGFIFYDKSPRNVSVETVKAIVAKLPAGIEKVGVFVGESAVRVNEIVHAAGLSAAQVYTGETDSSPVPADLPMLDYKLIVAMPFDQLLPGQVISGPFPGAMIYALLIDSGSGKHPGGTGLTFAWQEKRELMDYLTKSGKVIVAGGLAPTNVEDAVAILKPWGVDVSSGVEASPGKKNPEKVRAFVHAVREYDRKAG